MPVTKFNGYAPDGSMVFEDAGGMPITTAQTPEAVEHAQALTAQAGGDPSTAMPPGNGGSLYAPVATGMVPPKGPDMRLAQNGGGGATQAGAGGATQAPPMQVVADSGGGDFSGGTTGGSSTGAHDAPPAASEGAGGGGGAGGGPAAPAGGAPAAPSLGAPLPHAGAGGGGGPVGPTDNDNAAGFWRKASIQAGQSTPGYTVPGGTFLRGTQTQRQAGPDPEATKAREAAEKGLAGVASDQALLDSSAREDIAKYRGDAAAAQKQYAADVAKQREEEKAKLEPILAQLSKTSEEVREGKIDPDHAWKSKDSGQKALAYIGILLGGLGGKNGSNAALDMLNAETQRDIDAQVKNLGHKREGLNDIQKLYQLTKEQLGSDRAARAAVHLTYLDAIEAQIKRSAAMAESGEMGGDTYVPKAATETWHNPDGTTEEKYVYDSQGNHVFTQEKVEGQRYSLPARKALLENERQKAAQWEILSAAKNGTIGQSYETTQARHVAGSGPNYVKQAEYSQNAGKLAPSNDGKHSYFDAATGQRMTMHTPMEPGEAKEVRKAITTFDNMDAEIDRAEELYSRNPADRVKNQAVFQNVVNGLSAGDSVTRGMGVLQGNEREEKAKFAADILSGKDVLADIRRYVARQRASVARQFDARPAAAPGQTPYMLATPTDVAAAGGNPNPVGLMGAAPTSSGKAARAPKPSPTGGKRK